MEQTYKGIRGGDPLRRPPKYLATYPCPSCRQPATALTDFGLPGKHVCDDCRDSRQRGTKCSFCGSRKGLIFFTDDPYSENAYHKHCRKQADLENRY